MYMYICVCMAVGMIGCEWFSNQKINHICCACEWAIPCYIGMIMLCAEYESMNKCL